MNDADTPTPTQRRAKLELLAMVTDADICLGPLGCALYLGLWSGAYTLLKYCRDFRACMDSAQSNHVSIKIPKDLYAKVENRVKMSNEEFKSVEDYVVFLLTEVVSEGDAPSSDGNAYTKEEEEEIKGRLKNLGYI